MEWLCTLMEFQKDQDITVTKVTIKMPIGILVEIHGITVSKVEWITFIFTQIM